MAKNSGKLLIQLLKKIAIFDDLAPTQVRSLLGICESRSVAKEATLCTSGTPSDEMYILLIGQLSVVTEEGVHVATILPVCSVGEMGVITGSPRSATVVASSDSRILALNKRKFELSLRGDQDMASRIYKNVIQDLSAKLANNNERLRDYQLEIQEYEERIGSLEEEAEPAG